ncbi:VanZ family protein [Cytophaga aurantiaca]|uniref:VanZ family protein n=1 Tax=Cytophaga aurantiaca TaxID=29530 RepID=UPI00036126A5|nr:VanZ family protein [Cytophaga aurantiaca]
MISKIVKYFVTLIYFGLLCYIVFFSRRRINIHAEDVDQHLNTIPFMNTAKWFLEIKNSSNQLQWEFYTNFLGNILLFVPFPLICKYVFRIKGVISIILSGIILSCIIELMQWKLSIGIPDIDDVILNSLGVLIGCLPIFLFKNGLAKF